MITHCMQKCRWNREIFALFDLTVNAGGFVSNVGGKTLKRKGYDTALPWRVWQYCFFV